VIIGRKSTKLHDKLFFSIPKTFMDAASPDIASSEARVATDTRGEEDRMRLDGTSSTEE